MRFDSNFKYYLARTDKSCASYVIIGIWRIFGILVKPFNLSVFSDGYDNIYVAQQMASLYVYNPEPVQAEINYYLMKLSEECSELIQASSKAQAFGLHFGNPKTEISNTESLVSETCDVLATIKKLRSLGVYLVPEDSEERIKLKIKKMEKWKKLSDSLADRKAMDYLSLDGCVELKPVDFSTRAKDGLRILRAR